MNQEQQESVRWGSSSPWHEELFSNYEIFFQMRNGPVQAWGGVDSDDRQFVPDLTATGALKPMRGEK